MYRWFLEVINQTCFKKGDVIITAVFNVCRQPISAVTERRMALAPDTHYNGKLLTPAYHMCRTQKRQNAL